jgi:hypothetical protein
LLGRPYTLRYLRKLGFKTFSPFIDESYDFEIKDDKRLEMVYEEIIRLNSLPKEKLDEMLKSLNDILIFNQNHLIEMNKDRKLEKMFINFINETILK